MDSDLLPYAKFKILFINIFLVLYKAATLNPSKLQLDLKEIELALQNTSVVPLLSQLIIFLLSLFLIAKFIFGYLSLAANIVAIFPIICEEQPELLLPSIIAQAVENILLCLVEILLGYVTIKFYIPGKITIFALFIAKMIIKMTLSISTLNIYSDLYNHLKSPALYQGSTNSQRENGFIEEIIKQQQLF